MRVLLLAGSLVLIGAAATVACSSATPAATTADAGAPKKTTDDDDDTTSTTGSSTSSSSSSSGAVTPTDAGDDDAEAGTIVTNNDGGLSQGSDAGTACLADPTAFGELEPNDTAPGNELPVTGTGTFKFCGFVIAGNDDFVSFTVPQFQGASVQFTLPSSDISGTIGNQPFTGGNIPQHINPGDVWTTQLHTASTSGHAYEITFTFN